VTPEDERMSIVVVWPRWKQVARPDDRGPCTSRVPRDEQFPFDGVRIDTRGDAGDPRADRRGPQVHEHVPRLAQHDRLLAPDAVGLGNGNRGLDCTHRAMVDRRSGSPGSVSAMLSNRSAPPATVTPVLVYPDVRSAVAWLEAAFGFEER